MADDRDPADGDGRYHHLIEHIQDAVVEFELVDGAPVVRSVNRAFVDAFGYAAADVEGDPLNEWIVPAWLLEEAATFDERTGAGTVNYRRVRRETASGLREFLYRGIPYRDPTARTDGFAVYTDLTEITRQERRLQVLTRVLRHNLRNSATVIAGHAREVLETLDGAPAAAVDAAATVERAARDLEGLTAEAGDIHSVLSSAEAEAGVLDLPGLVRSVLADCRERHPSAAVTTDFPASLSVRGTSHLGLALESLVDNAVVHNPARTPRVHVSVSPAEAAGWAVLRVADDGPRIPSEERDVLTGRAEIEPTRHGSGLGLWLVKWTVESVGGELSFDTSDLGGNSVQLRLQRG